MAGRGDNGVYAPGAVGIDVETDLAAMERLPASIRVAIRDCRMEFSACEAEELLTSMSEADVLALILDMDAKTVVERSRQFYGSKHPEVVAATLRPNR